jgi:hypothetical protein
LFLVNLTTLKRTAKNDRSVSSKMPRNLSAEN